MRTSQEVISTTSVGINELCRKVTDLKSRASHQTSSLEENPGPEKEFPTKVTLI
jgi:hypothetical protein